MRRKIISDYLAVLHYEANALQLGNVSDRIPGNGDKVSEFPGLKSTHAILPAQHFRSVGRDGANDVKGRHPGVMQDRKPCCRGLAARFSWIEPAHVRSGGKLHSRLQNPLNQTVVSLPAALNGFVEQQRVGVAPARASR